MARNPIWDNIPEERQMALVSDHLLDGPSPPAVMHLDVLLIRRDNNRGRGELWTYFSRAWGANLVPFRPWLSDDNPACRSEMNAQKLAKYLDGDLDSIVVTPLPRKFSVSVKPNIESRELTIYVFELCSVVFKRETEALKKLKDEPSGPGGGRWFDLDTMRTDSSVWNVNADLVHSIHKLFGVTLGPLPLSFEGGEIKTGQ